MPAAKHLEVVWWDGRLVGHVVNRGALYFGYDDEWIASGHNLSPLSLPFTTTAFNGAKLEYGLPGIISDCLPDAWGEKVARREFLRNKWGEPTPLTLLAWRGDRGVGALRFRPALDRAGRPAKAMLEEVSAAALAVGARAIERQETSALVPTLAKGATVGGAFPKTLIIDYGDGTLSVGPPDGIGIPSILKLDTADAAARRQDLRCEHAFTRMAAAAGITTVETRLQPEEPGNTRVHLLVRRFDIADPTAPARRHHFHSLAGILHKAPTHLDYTDFFRAALVLAVAPEEIREICRRMVFNLLAGNSDDHGKNHGFLYDDQTRRWKVSPAYDLTYNGMVLERGLTINGEVWPKKAVLPEMAKSAGIHEVEFGKIYDNIAEAVSAWPTYAKAAGVSKETVAEISKRQSRIRKVVDG